MNIIDIAILVVMLVFILKDFRKGFTEVVFSLLALISGLYLASKFYLTISPYVKKLTDSQQLSDIIAFIILFVAINFAINKIGVLFKELLEKLYLGWVNKTLGGGVGFLKGFLLAGTILMIVSYLSIPSINKEMSQSKVSPYLLSMYSKVFQFALKAIPDDLKKKGSDYVKEIAQSEK